MNRSSCQLKLIEFGFHPGGGGVYFHTYMYVGSGHFRGFKILNFNIFGVFRKMNIFGV